MCNPSPGFGRLFCPLPRPCYACAVIPARRLAVLVGAGAFALYLRTLAPSVAELFDDSLEFQLVGYRLAIAHPTGYPLYTLMLKAFSFLPVGDVAYRANLLSALCAALAVAVVYLILLQLTQSVLPSLVAALALAISPVFWSQSVITEVYALNALFVAAITYVLIGDGEAQANARIPAGRLTALAFLFGLALTHHRTIVLLAPAVLIFLVLDWRALIFRLKIEPPPSSIALPALALLAPLLLYLYIPLRGAAGSLDGTYQNTPEGFVRWIFASNYNIFLTQNPFNENRDAAFFANLFLQQFGALGLALVLIGFGALVREERWRHSAVFLAAAFLAYLAFMLFYRVPDVEVFAIPAFLVEAVLIGVGVGVLWQTGGRARVVVRALLLLALALNFGSVFQAAFAANDLSQRTEVRDYGRDMLSQDFPPDSTLVGILGEMTLVRYLQATEHLQTELATVAADRDDARLAAIAHALQSGRSVFTTRPLNGMPERYALGAFGPLVRVWPEPQPGTLPADAPQVDTIRYRLDSLSRPQPQVVRVRITWQPTAPLASDLKVSARLLDGERLLAQHDDWPVHNAYHTTFWRTGETIADAYDVRLPSEPAGAALRVLLVVYRADSGAEVGRIEAGPLNAP